MLITTSFLQKELSKFFNKNSRMIDNNDLHEEFHNVDISGDRVLREDDLILLSSFLAERINKELDSSAMLQTDMMETQRNLLLIPIHKSKALSGVFAIISSMIADNH
jgi:hypothetical protein